MKAIAAMSLNRVIGVGNQMPWHLPEDFKWFKKMTIGRIIVFGRKTYEGLGRHLPNRINIVLTRNPKLLLDRHQTDHLFLNFRAGLTGRSFDQFVGQTWFETTAPPCALASSLSILKTSSRQDDIFICGGAQVYQQALPLCSDLYLTVVNREVEGDAFFPEFESLFEFKEVLKRTPEFEVRHYVRNQKTERMS